MRVKIALAAAAAGIALAACGGGPMTYAQAQAQAKSIYASSHLESDARQLQIDGGNGNVAALQQDARKMSADAKNANAAVRSANWPSSYRGRTRKVETVLAEVVACMNAFSSANGMAEIAAAEQGNACQALNALNGGG